MELVFDDEAIADLENIHSWIAKDSPSAAKNVVQRLFSSAELLISFPLMGHAGREPDTFEWVVPRLPYIVIYEVDRVGERIVITAVLHGAQDRERASASVKAFNIGKGFISVPAYDSVAGSRVYANDKLLATRIRISNTSSGFSLMTS